LVLLVEMIAFAQVTVTISEPAPLTLEKLFEQADVVAVLEVLSGDSENYAVAVYRARTVEPFKGTVKDQIIFFGPFIGYRVGYQYVAFLRRLETGMRPEQQATENATLSFGEVTTPYGIMYDGYSIMPVEYVCKFHGDRSNEVCDDGVQINTYQVKLPASIKTFPRDDDDEPVSDTGWVRKDVLIRALNRW